MQCKKKIIEILTSVMNLQRDMQLSRLLRQFKGDIEKHRVFELRGAENDWEIEVGLEDEAAFLGIAAGELRSPGEEDAVIIEETYGRWRQIEETFWSCS